MGKQPNLYAFAEVDNLAKSLRKYVLQCQRAGFERHHAFKVAVSGGSLPKTLAKALLAHGDGNSEDTVDFSKWEIFFADERAVPLDHEDSNYKLLKEELLDKIPSNMGEPTVHPIDVQYMDDVQEMADQYQDSLMKSFAAKDSVKIPIFDLLLLGCGPDGHTCSLFPNHELLRESDAWVAAIEDSPKPPASRITLTLPVVTHGVKIAFVATGDGKRKILKEILDTEEGRSLPCGLVNEGGGEKVSWFTDNGAVEGVGFPRRGNL
ncbi:suppressor of los1-1 [Mycoblastus sanguinarius]|nr:suppressor of los1-1 [Mycoblastus sanguinarius]